MSRPREVVPGRIHLITRRCTQRQFLLRPDRDTVQIFLYCLAEAATRFDITVFAWIVMSDHYHLLVRDNVGNYPEFIAHLHRMLAKVMNVLRRRKENFWSSEKTNVVWTVDHTDAFDKLIYILANPVAADAVEHAVHWPGATSLNQNLGGHTKTIKRPKIYFDPEAAMPEEVELRVERLDGYEHLSQEKWHALVLEHLALREKVARDKRRDAGRSVQGRRSVLATSPEHRATREEHDSELEPVIACKDKTRRNRELGLLQLFHEAYEAALAKWRGGDHAVPFPPGTYKMRWYGAVVAPD